jgi:dihydroorotate dehydrogenase (fumarate)
MDIKNYKSIDDFRGKLSRNRLSGDPFVYKRAQYVDLLLNSDAVFKVEGTSRISSPED